MQWIFQKDIFISQITGTQYAQSYIYRSVARLGIFKLLLQIVHLYYRPQQVHFSFLQITQGIRLCLFLLLRLIGHIFQLPSGILRQFLQILIIITAGTAVFPIFTDAFLYGKSHANSLLLFSFTGKCRCRKQQTHAADHKGDTECFVYSYGM